MTSLFRRCVAVGAVAALSFVAAACGGDDQEGSGETTITWWHIQNQDPMKKVWADLAKKYEAQNDGVNIKITALENESFKTRLTTSAQSGEVPDIFQSWGGGILQSQVDAGLVKDITADVESWSDTLLQEALLPYQADGKTYGIPFDMGMVGFWYNKDLFAEAGIEGTPETWTEFLDAVGKLKDAGITPLAVAGGEKWPVHYYWAYLAMREAGVEGVQEAAAKADFTGPEFVKAGEHFRDLIELEPFQKGFLNAAFADEDGQAAAMGNGDAAMSLMGQWAPTTQEQASGKALGDKLGFFPFPAVEGGAGAATEVMGGGNGFAIGAEAPPEAADFLRFLLSEQNYQSAVDTGDISTVLADAEIENPNLQAVRSTLEEATAFQLYLDQDFPPAIGEQVNDSSAALLAGSTTPEDMVQQITTVAQREQ